MDIPKLDLFLDLSQDMLCLTDSVSATFLWVNTNWTKTLGYREEEILNSSYMDFIHPEDIEATNRAIAQLSSQRPIINFRNRYRHKNGHYLWLEWSSTPYKQFVYATCRDVSEQVISERCLIESETKYRLLFKHMTSGFALHEMIYDDQGNPFDYRFLEINPAFEELTGISAEMALGKTVREFLPVEALKWIDLYASVVQSGQSVTFEEDSPQLQKYFHILAFSPEENRFATIFTDITEKRQLEEQLHQSEKLEAIGQLAGGIAHDFNNQLTGIIGFTDLLKQDIRDLQQQEYLNEIIHGASQAGRLIHQLLTFARKEKKQQRPINIHDVINDVIKILKRSIDKRIKIKLKLYPEKLWTLGDYAQLQSGMLNLGINARDAMPNGGILTLSTMPSKPDNQIYPDCQDKEFLRVEVIDSGTGIPEEIQKHIFEPFFTTKEVGNGTGLGLATLYGTIKAHNGYVHVHSNEQQGSCFSIYLPLIKPNIPEDPVELDSP